MGMGVFRTCRLRLLFGLFKYNDSFLRRRFWNLGRGRLLRNRFRRRGRFGSLWLLGYRPHVHRYSPVGLNDRLPDLGKNYITIGPYQVIVTLGNVRSDYLDVKKSLTYKFFHPLH